MTSKSKHTVRTQYGEATIETYECDSCGNTVAYENTVAFTIGSVQGRACEHCKNTGPVSFPKRGFELVYPVYEVGSERYGVVFHTVLFPLISVLLIVKVFGGNGDTEEKNFVFATIAFALWALAIVMMFLHVTA